VTTIVKTVIGSGILTIPYTMGRMGYVLGIALFLGGACLVQFASILLLKAKNLSHHSNYATIFYAIWPSRIAKGIGSLIIFLTNMGVCKALQLS
jgi:amino acid permease